MQIKQFKVGKTYWHNYAGSSDLISKYTVLARTKKTVTIIEEGMIKQITRRIYIYDKSECVRPDGTYSMCPILRAENEVRP